MAVLMMVVVVVVMVVVVVVVTITTTDDDDGDSDDGDSEWWFVWFEGEMSSTDLDLNSWFPVGGNLWKGLTVQSKYINLRGSTFTKVTL